MENARGKAACVMIAVGAAVYASSVACGSSSFETADAGSNVVNGQNCDVTLTPSTTAGSNPDGTRAHPYPTFQAGIAAAKQQKKRVYACIGDYAEQVTLADGISMFGDLDCNQNWTVVTSHARVVAPVSPAMQGTQIQSTTRIDSIDVKAPDGTAASPTSIAMIVTSSPGLTIANASIVAGTGFNGIDGTPGIQLIQTGTLNGSTNPAGSNCNPQGGLPINECPDNDSAGGTSVCSFPDGGLADDGGWNGGSGGSGGTGGGCIKGGECEVDGVPVGCCTDVAHSPGTGTAPPGGNAGQNGTNGTSGADAVPGTLSATGYTPANGSAGANGSPGAGGSGGAGSAVPITQGEAMSGMSGGAGGCPGLAGTAGTGGGASIAVLANASATTFATCIIQSSSGGNAGKRTFGSAPTPGGNGAGNGGSAGWSGNGSAGPSYGIASHQIVPTLVSTSPIAGSGGKGVAAVTSGDQTIPATPDGESAATKTF